MKKVNLIILVGILFVSVSGLSAVAEKAEPLKPKERIEEPKSREEAERLKERTEKAEEERQKTEQRIKENQVKLANPRTLPEDKQDIRKQMRDDQSYIDSIKTTIDEAKATLDEPAVKKLLAQAYEAPTAPVDQYEYDQRTIQGALRTESSIKRVIDWVERTVTPEAIQATFEEEGGLDASEKISEIDIKRGDVQNARRAVEAELAKEGLNAAKRDSLERLKNRLEQAQEGLDGLTLQIDKEQIGFFTKLAQGVRTWFDKKFDIHKTSPEKRSIDDELKRIEAGKNVLASVKKIRLFEDANKYIKDASGLVRTIENTPADAMPIAIEGLQSRGQEAIDNLDTLQKSLEQNKALEDAYDDLQRLSGELVAKEKRYKGDSPTLFESELAAYQKELVGSNFKPNQMYEALGFRPEDAPTITNEQIDEAYQRISKQAGPGSSPQGRAARNASTILKDPVAKATYDAFLRDWNHFAELGIDPANLNDQGRSWLNTKGELSTLEISKKQFDKIQTAKHEVMEAMSAVGLKLSDKTSLSDSLDKAKKDLGMALAKAQGIAQQQAGGMPPG